MRHRDRTGSRGDRRLGTRIAGQDGKRRDSITPKIVFEAAARGDRDAKQIIAHLIEQIAQGIAAVICVLNPETVILGGEIAEGESLLIEPLRARVSELVPRPPRRFACSALGQDSAALGAMQVALRQAQDRIFENPTYDSPDQ